MPGLYQGAIRPAGDESIRTTTTTENNRIHSLTLGSIRCINDDQSTRLDGGGDRRGGRAASVGCGGPGRGPLTTSLARSLPSLARVAEIASPSAVVTTDHVVLSFQSVRRWI